MVDVIEHETKVTALLDRNKEIFVRLDEREARRKFSRSKRGLMKALTLACTPIEGGKVLSRAIIRASLAGEFETRLDHIGHVTQNL